MFFQSFTSASHVRRFNRAGYVSRYMIRRSGRAIGSLRPVSGIGVT